MLAGQWLGYSRSNAGDVPNEFSNEENVRLRLLAVVLTVTGIRLLRGGKARQGWLVDGVSATLNAELIFIDPDTGFEVPSMDADQAPKYVLFSEILSHTSQGQTVIAYQHQPHEKLEPYVLKIVDRIRGDGGFDGYIEVVKFGGGGSVVYFIMSATDHRDVIIRRVKKLVERGRGEYVRVDVG